MNVIACFAYFALAVALSAAPASLPEYHARAWTTDHGLPHNSVNKVIQDATGFLWFATVGGLARFDGLNFQQVSPPAEYRPYGLNIRDVGEEQPGTLIILPAGNTVLRLRAGHWTKHPLNAALEPLSETPTAVHVDFDGNVWITTERGLLLRWDGREQSAHVFNPADDWQGNRPTAVVARADGGVWINAGGLWHADAHGTLNRIEGAADDIRWIAPARNGMVWALANDRLHLADDRRVLETQILPAEVMPMGVRHVFEDHQRTLWIATSRQGLFRFVDGRLERVSSYPSVSFVSEDHELNLWLATDGNGAGQIQEKPFRILGLSSGLQQEIVSSIAEDSRGQIWLANRSGGVALANQEGHLQSTPLKGTHAFANAIAVDDRDRILFGGGRNGLSRWSPATANLEKLPRPAADIHVIFRAGNGDIWFAADSQEVGYYRGEALHLIASETPFLDHIRAIAEDLDGNIWLGGRHGVLLRWAAGKLESFESSQPFPRTPIHSIVSDAEGRLWIGTAAGLVLKENNRFTLLTEANGLTDDIIEEIVPDGSGRLWFASRRGLFHAEKSDLLRAARDPAHRIRPRRLGPHQGLFALTPTANFAPSALRAKNGFLWFATAQGAVVVDPLRALRELPATRVLIDAVKLNGKPVPQLDEFKINSGRHRLEFGFAALSYSAPEAVELRHRLEGIDDDWIETTSDRTATYNNLSPGEYRMQVMATNSAGEWSDETAVLAFTVVPAWWETAIARIAFAAIVAGAIAALARHLSQRRMRHRLHQLEQQHALEKERSRIARDLHDDLGAGLTEVGLLADRLVQGSPPQLAPKLSGLARRTRRLSTDLSGIVWTMNARHEALDQLASFIPRYAERLFRHSETRCIARTAEPIPALPLHPDLQHQILAATKEALNNVLKHARASEVALDLRCSENEFEIEIRDNGTGCDWDQAAGDGNGLKNMRARIEEIGGRFEASSTVGQGTVIRFHVPLVR